MAIHGFFLLLFMNRYEFLRKIVEWFPVALTVYSAVFLLIDWSSPKASGYMLNSRIDSVQSTLLLTKILDKIWIHAFPKGVSAKVNATD